MDDRPFQITVLITLLVALALFGSAQAQPVVAPVFEAETIDEDVAIGYGLEIGDVDGDGDGDLDVLLADKSEIVWYRNGDRRRFVIADNTMATEDLKVADLDGDGRLDVVGSERDTHNVILYWNRTDT